jgi:hypothetical protein
VTTVDLAIEHPSVEDILRLAESGVLVVRTSHGRVFSISEVTEGGEGDDFSDEIALTRHNAALRALLTERSKEPGKYSIDDVREKLGLGPQPR